MKNFQRRLLFAIILLLSACGAQTLIAPTPPANPLTAAIPDLKQSLSGRIVFTRGDNALWLLNPAPKASPQKILTTAQSFTPTYPAWSHDGKRIAYTLLNLMAANGFPESDLLIANADGSANEVLLKHQQNGEQLSAPLWSLDDRVIYFSRLTLIYQNQIVSSAKRELVRLDLQTQQQSVVLPDAHEFALSPRGDQFAYIRIDPVNYAQSLWLSDTQGRAPHPALNSPSRGVLLSPRFSPDGQTVLVASSSPLSAQVQPRGWRMPVWTPFVSIASAHGDPFDLWLVNLSNQTVRRLTELGEDMPHASWSPDGKWIAFVGAQGVYVMDAQGRNLQMVNRAGGHGQIDWIGE